MAFDIKITCDVCGTMKKDTNHWFVLVQNKTSVTVFTSAPDGVSSPIPRIKGTDCCGEACVLKKVSELISKQ